MKKIKQDINWPKVIIQLNFLVMGLLAVTYIMWGLKSEGLSPKILEVIGVKPPVVNSGPIKAQVLPAKSPDQQSGDEK